jgi:carbon-monoxide dehydrogenase small subunit
MAKRKPARLEQTVEITLAVNGVQVTRRVDARQHLVDFLREELGLTGSHVGCEHGVCGACTLRVDGKIVRGCLTLAAQAAGKSVETIEGLSDAGTIAALQEAFHQRNALQCGYCTPGMLMSSYVLLERNPSPTEEEIRWGISGNLCRCTGYQNIVKAVQFAAEKLAEGEKHELSHIA